MRLPELATTPTRPTVRDHRILNVAHRGASAQAAENTLAAVRRAVDCGADLIELDVQRTRDGALVVLHDTTLVRTTDARRVFPGRAPWRVADFTHAELMRLDAGSWRSGVAGPQRIPTLAEVIDEVRRGPAGLLVELKAPELYPGIVTDVVATLRSSPGYLDAALPTGRLVVQSFDFAAMKDLKTQLPHVPVGLLGTPARAHLPVLASWADQVNPSHHAVDAAYVERVHQLGMACLVWTVNRSHGMKRALRMGVDGVITNRPDALAAVLHGRVVAATS